MGGDNNRIEEGRTQARTEARTRLRRIIAKVIPHQIKSALVAVARRFGWRSRRTAAIYRGEARIIESHEMDTLREDIDTNQTK